MSERESYDKLIALARKINPNLPADVSGCEITMSFNRDGMSATARKVIERPIKKEG